MFSVYQQAFILELFYRKTMMKKEQKTYACNVSFYSAMGYLKDAGLLKATRKGVYHIYELTEKGKLFANWLSNLPDNKYIVADYEKRYGLPAFKELADRLF